MAKGNFDNFDQDNDIDLVTKKKNPAVLGFLIFVSVVGVIALLIWTVVIPLLNKNLSNIGIKSVNEFIDFYKEINGYVAEGEVVKNPYSYSDYVSAYEKFINDDLKIFKNNEVVSDISEEKIDEYKEDGYPVYSPVKLKDRELAALIANALKSENLIKQLDVEIIETYKLSLEVKEFTIGKGVDESFTFKVVGKISLKDVASTLPWPYNGMIPDNIYVTVQSEITYLEDGAHFRNCEIKVNKVSENTNRIIIDVVNSQIKDENVEPLTLEGLSEELSRIVYARIENFASLLDGNIRIILDEEDNVLFELSRN